MDAIGFGALNVDLIYRADRPDHLPELGIEWRPGGEILGGFEDFKRLRKILETNAAKIEKSGGGSAANTVFALSRMGFKTGYIGKVGTDSEGEFLINQLEDVDTSRVRREGLSGFCLILLDQTRDRFMLLFPNTNDDLREEEIDVPYISKARYLHLSSFSGPLPFRAQIETANCLSQNVCISFDPGELYAKRGIQELGPLLEHCKILFVTDKEAKMLTGLGYPRGAIKLLDTGPEIVVCKKGSSGSHVFKSSGDFEIPAERIEVVDRTGAGDVYDAGFLAGLLLGLPLDRCAVLATKAAARSITGYGRDRYPDRTFLDSFLKEAM
jgi:ribokinase